MLPFGNSETAKRLNTYISEIVPERKRLAVSRKISTLLSRYNCGMNELREITVPHIALELILLWRNKHLEIIRKEHYDKDIKDRLLGLVRERAKFEMKEVHAERKDQKEFQRQCNGIFLY